MGNSNVINIELEDQHAPNIKTGYLMKESKHIKQYRKRWMVLKATLLFISYKNTTLNQPTEEFDLREYTEIKPIPLTNKFQLISLNSQRTFQAESELERSEWIEAINKLKADSNNPEFQTQKLFWQTRLQTSLYSCNDKTTFPKSNQESLCHSVQRLKYIFRTLEKHKYPHISDAFSIKSFIVDDLYNYSNIHLLNDYLHVLREHGLIGGFKNLFDIKKFNCNNASKECVSTDRFFSDSASFESKTDSDVEELTCLHFVDIIHCNLFHATYIENVLFEQSNEKFKTNVDFGSNTEGNVRFNDRFDVAPITYYEIAPRFDYSDAETDLTLNKNLLFVFKKYNDLKEEMLNYLTLSQWSFVAYKASIFDQSLLANGIVHLTNSVVYFKKQKHKEYDLSRLNLDLIICLVLLCDFENITILLRNSYSRISMQETDDELIKRHAEFYHLAKLSKICVEIFGKGRKLLSYSRNKQVFHVINDAPEIVFGWLRVKWNYPISVVTNLKRLKNVNNGIVIEFNREDGICFDCSLISKCYLAKEELLMDYKQKRYQSVLFGFGQRKREFCEDDNEEDICTAPLKIRNIENGENEAQQFISLFHEFTESMVMHQRTKNHGGYYDSTRTMDDLSSLIQNKFTSSKNYGNISKYVKSAINSYFRGKMDCTIDIGLLRTRHKYLGALFLSERKINFPFISYLFPKCDEVIVHSPISKHNIHINDSFMEWLFKTLVVINTCPIKENMVVDQQR
eukprot:504588_1